MENVYIAASGNEPYWKEVARVANTGIKPLLNHDPSQALETTYYVKYQRTFRFRKSRLDSSAGIDKLHIIIDYLQDKFVKRYGKVLYIDRGLYEQDRDNIRRGLVTILFTICTLEHE